MKQARQLISESMARSEMLIEARQAEARQMLIFNPTVKKVKASKIVKTVKASRSKASKTEVKPEVEIIEVKKVKKVKQSDLISYYDQKAKQLRNIGFNGKIELSEVLIQDVCQETVLKLFEAYESKGKPIEKVENLFNRTMHNVTVNKWNYSNYSIDNIQPFIEFSNQKSEIELQKISVNGHKWNSDFWNEYHLTLKYCYYVLSGGYAEKKAELRRLKKRKTQTVLNTKKVKFKVKKTDKKNIVVFNLYHVKQFTLNQIGKKLKMSKQSVFERVSKINRRLMNSGIVELYRLDYIITDYRVPDYKYSEIIPIDLNSYEHKLFKGKVIYANEPYQINISDYDEQKKVTTIDHEKILDTKDKYSFTKQSFITVKKPIPTIGLVRTIKPTLKNRQYVDNLDLKGKVTSQNIARSNDDIVFTDLIGYQDKKIFDTVGININDGLSKSCDICGYSIDHCRCAENSDIEYLESLNV